MYTLAEIEYNALVNDDTIFFHLVTYSLWRRDASVIVTNRFSPQSTKNNFDKQLNGNVNVNPDSWLSNGGEH